MARERFEDVDVKIGFAGHEREVTIKTHEDDAPPWGLDSKLAVVGTRVPRVDGPDKLTGRAKYAYDINLPGLLYGKILRCPHPKAKITSIDVSGALAVPGVKAAVKALNAGQTCRFAGHEVAAVAAETLDAAEDGLEAIRVEYEVLEFNTDPARAEHAPPLDDKGDVVPPPKEDRQAGLDRAYAAAAAVREGTWRTQCQTHSSLETHGGTAWFKKDGKLVVWASTQSTFSVQRNLASSLRIPQSDVQVITEFMGGGFGSKLGSDLEMKLAAELSKESGVPVKLMLSRKEEHIAVGNRPLSLQHIKAAVDQEGKITAWDHWSWGNPGYTGRGGNTTSPGFYFGREAVTRRGGAELQTDTNPARAFRAPGWPQGYFAFEGMLDELADALGMDPLELRLRNDRTALRQHEFRLGAEKIGWNERRNKTPGEGGRMLRGLGCSAAAWGGSGRPAAQVTCRIHPDGSVEMRNGAQDIGTGMKTVMAVLGAEELSIPVARIKVFMGDTMDPIGPGSGGSTTTPSLAPAARHAAWLAKGELLAKVAAHWQVDVATLSLAGGRIVFGGEPARTLEFGEACKLLGTKAIEVTGTRFNNYRAEDYAAGVCGAMFAEVEVDSELGIVHVRRLVGVQDCGRVMDELTAESQVLGAMIQGISYALHEDKVFDHRVGRVVNPDFVHYKISGPKDMPEMEVHMVNVATGHTNTGAMGLGEPPAVAVPAAIANAVRNAVGAPVRSLPITPDKVLAALAARRS